MLLSLAAVVTIACGLGWIGEARRGRAGRARERADHHLSVQLILWMAQHATQDGNPEPAQAWRCVERAGKVASILGVEAGPLRLAASLPPGMLAARDVELPTATRKALALRHARWDGGGLPRGLAGDDIPAEAQALAVVDWLELRDDGFDLATQIRAEAGRRFSPQVVDRIAQSAEDLAAIRSPDLVGGFRVLRGALLCITPDLTAEPAELRPRLLRDVAESLRARLRPADRVRINGDDVVLWLKDADADGAVAVQHRLRPALGALVLPSGRPLACTYGVALADTDATSFAALLSVARERRSPLLLAQRAA